MTAKPTPDALTNGRQGRGLAEELTFRDDRNGGLATRSIWGIVTPAMFGHRTRPAVRPIDVAGVERGVEPPQAAWNQNRCLHGPIPLGSPDRSTERRARYGPRSPVALTLQSQDSERMNRYTEERLVTSARGKGESKGKRPDGTATDRLEHTHVPVGYQNRAKAVYIPDGRVYSAYHVPTGEVHLLPIGDGTQHRLAEREAGDVSVIA